MPLPAHPGYFEVLACRRAWTTLLYLLLSLTTGILAFTYAVTGLSLSLGLAILILGVPVAVAFLAGARLLAVGERRLLGLLVGGDGAPLPALLPAGEGWLARLRALVGDRRTWTSLLYFLLLLPLGVGYFTLLVTVLSVGLALASLPVVVLFHGAVALDLAGPSWLLAHPGLAAVLCGLAGLALVPLSLHLALLMGCFQTWLARHLLVAA